MPAQVVSGAAASVGGLKPTVSLRSDSGQPTTVIEMGSFATGQPSTSLSSSSWYTPGISLNPVTVRTQTPHGGSTPAAGTTAKAAPLPPLRSRESSSCTSRFFTYAWPAALENGSTFSLLSVNRSCAHAAPPPAGRLDLCPEAAPLPSEEPTLACGTGAASAPTTTDSTSTDRLRPSCS
eukprot:scaffold1355_cov268-Pinguiococcus_pyrenoidosus.AAC.75